MIEVLKWHFFINNAAYLFWEVGHQLCRRSRDAVLPVHVNVEPDGRQRLLRLELLHDVGAVGEPHLDTSFLVFPALRLLHHLGGRSGRRSDGSRCSSSLLHFPLLSGLLVCLNLGLDALLCCLGLLLLSPRAPERRK